MKKVKFDLPEGWIDISQENPDGPSTFLNEKSSSQGVFQISYVEYVKGEIPSPSEKELINLARHAGQSLGEFQEEESGECFFGEYGKVSFFDVQQGHYSYV